MEKFIYAFVIGGLICVIGQLIMDILKITPAHTTCTLVVIGAILGGLGLYDPLVKLAGAGAFVPISSFGNTLVTGALIDAEKTGFIGIFTGIFKTGSSGISAAIVFGFIGAILFKPKG
ncbi:stage V sporulation protein AE [Clostridium sp. CM028]|uniref:stage V sporulation protein AE n=1 Tax=unclassified Clostridium TaxID=2614128 RepID=UPI001C0D1FC3|nr:MULTISPECIES: stage V sporulation protein AE [unclassified Clostridium]MBU3093863.1 stage V sporulation protein AE [Clostridium sp. CF011]MBW9150557.1 stage V sporulation protein AE [Clostridium sp. CM028]WAG70893.1 stage V sporulation protein AE [Clostridium sp. CF011]WLC62515.1 stage V sporulation protein AE [Clostridium sp. CM028]